MAIWRRVACWISKATRAQAQPTARAPTHARTNAHARTREHTEKYVRLTAFLRQQCFRERATTLRYTYIEIIIFFLFRLDTHSVGFSFLLGLWLFAETCNLTVYCVVIC